ncbi:hypothetical protein RC88_09125 [Pectobacterium parvum]|nr:hypothetical protein RC88_09125 [Pectobacterium parvum]
MDFKIDTACKKFVFFTSRFSVSVELRDKRYKKDEIKKQKLNKYNPNEGLINESINDAIIGEINNDKFSIINKKELAFFNFDFSIINGRTVTLKLFRR